MKLYYLDGESVSIEVLRKIATNLSGKDTFYYTDDDIINLLSSHGMNVKINSIDCGVYGILNWFRP